MKPILLLFMLIFTACVHVEPVSGPVPTPTPKPAIVVEPKQTPPPVLAPVDEISAMAVSSECARAAHGAQGIPPKSFMKGIAHSFARSICHFDREAVQVAAQPLGSPSKDALAHYGLQPGSAESRLAATYALMVGSAARESSWRWCVGKDPGADNTSSETCEAGLYQTSYNSRSAHAVLPKLYAEFKLSKAACFEPLYKSTTTCSDFNMKNWGSGEGVEFQQLTKHCPGFASEYHAVMLRTQRTHYGPINRKMVTYVPACAALFEKLSAHLKAHPEICARF